MTHSLSIITRSQSKSIPIHALATDTVGAWIRKQPATTQKWLKANDFTPTAGHFCLLPAGDGSLAGVLCCIDDTPTLWSLASLATTLPAHTYRLSGRLSKDHATQLTLGWALAGYHFNTYKKNNRKYAKLIAPTNADMVYIKSMAQSIFWARDLINSPANDMNPTNLAKEAINFGRKHKAKIRQIKGKELLKANYPMIYTVGQASQFPPQLIDLRFTNKGAPKVTLVGKGICFDSGGLDIKPSSGMVLMKKDMGGAACVLALAKSIVETKLPVDLRVLLPIAENAIGSNAMRPSDIVKTRKGLSVEIGNTDAEGRLVLCDALSDADDEKPDLLIDCATLTGAARVALGTEIPAFFTDDDQLSDQLVKHGEKLHDPLWRLPLWSDYKKQLEVQHADLNNIANGGYGGAITAALYLREFVSKTPSWLHVDLMAWNINHKPGRPQGGEAMGVRALYALIKERFT